MKICVDVTFTYGYLQFWVAYLLFLEAGPVSGTHKENQKLRQYVQHLQEENNFLKLKFEILLDMVIDMTLHNTFS